LEPTFEAHVAPLAFSGRTQEPDFLLITLRDLTQQQRIERMRADFVANASHELRTPLAALLGFIETLRGPARDDPLARERFLPIMQAQAERMSRLISDLLSLSRIEVNEHVRPGTPVNLAEVIGHVGEGLGPVARETGVELILDLPPGPLPVLGERDELVRVFENLVENAIKYGAAGKRVEVVLRRVEAPRPQAEVAVRDFGPGIPPEHVPRLTERFYRVDATESRQKGGTGLGLALVKHILARHRGTLAIDSEVGRGSTFTVRLDLAKAADERNGSRPFQASRRMQG
ncbi:MAG TPA: ATP-binding protein, partial [Microvirga sp.]|nr:ATP-binding protein [Microvirga sp.]